MPENELLVPTEISGLVRHRFLSANCHRYFPSLKTMFKFRMPFYTDTEQVYSQIIFYFKGVHELTSRPSRLSVRDRSVRDRSFGCEKILFVPIGINVLIRFCFANLIRTSINRSVFLLASKEKEKNHCFLHL